MARILAISSGGGHWEQLMIVKEAFTDHDVIYANTIEGLAEKSGVGPSWLVKDCNRNRPVQTLLSAIGVFRLILKTRPDFVITTGAAPGLLALGIGKIFGAKTIWVDSVANSERLSMSGKWAGRFADHHLSQWPHVAEETGAKYMGSVL